VEGWNAPTAPACSGAIDVSVLIVENTPTFTWKPSCGVSYLSVSRDAVTPGAAPESMWAFNVPENNPVAPDVPYGKNPSRAAIWADPKPLQPGVRYLVEVRQTLGGDASVAHGSVYFIAPYPPD